MKAVIIVVPLYTCDDDGVPRSMNYEEELDAYKSIMAVDDVAGYSILGCTIEEFEESEVTVL